jgi:hypothetical protein
MENSRHRSTYSPQFRHDCLEKYFLIIESILIIESPIVICTSLCLYGIENREDSSDRLPSTVESILPVHSSADVLCSKRLLLSAAQIRCSTSSRYAAASRTKETSVFSSSMRAQVMIMSSCGITAATNNG